jgi:hypothetical protein
MKFSGQSRDHHGEPYWNQNFQGGQIIHQLLKRTSWSAEIWRAVGIQGPIRKIPRSDQEFFYTAFIHALIANSLNK